MSTVTNTIYGPGGYDPTQPNDNVIAVEQITLDPEAVNLAVLQSAAETALTNNIAALALPDPTPANETYLALASPTTPQAVAQVKALTTQIDALIAQVQALTKQNDALIRLALGLLDSTDGT